MASWFGRLLGRIWNRRRDNRRFSLKLEVRATDPDDDPYEAVSQDVSDRGIRLRFEEPNLAHIIGHRDEVPLEITLSEDFTVRVQAKVVWAYTVAEGGTASGWQFVHFRGNARRRLRNYLDQQEPSEPDE